MPDIRIACAGPNRGSAVAVFETTGSAYRGNIKMNMDGKNMTMSETQVAEESATAASDPAIPQGIGPHSNVIMPIVRINVAAMGLARFLRCCALPACCLLAAATWLVAAEAPRLDPAQ